MKRLLLIALLALVTTAVFAADEDLLRLLANPPGTGLMVTQTVAGGRGAAAGLREGDIIVKYGGETVSTREGFIRLIMAKSQEPNIPLVVLRGGKEQELQVKGGRLGLALTAVEKGKPIRRPAETPYEPNLKALKNEETYYDFKFGETKAGFELHKLSVKGDSVSLTRIVRFKFGEFDEDMVMQMELAKGKGMPVKTIDFRSHDQQAAKLKREGLLLEGKSGDDNLRLITPSNAVPSWAVEVVARTMPREVGACYYFTRIEELGVLSPNCEILCAAKESVTVAGAATETYRYDVRRYGEVTDRYWITADDRLLKADYTGPIAELSTKEKALSNLPEGVSKNL
jgi:hypothetical protein